MGRGMWAAVALAVAAILSGTAWPVRAGGLEPGHFMRLVQNALCGKVVYFVMPVAAVLPWSDSVLQERKGGFLKSVLPRGTRLGYAQNKALAVALGSFLAWVRITVRGLGVRAETNAFKFPRPVPVSMRAARSLPSTR